MSGKNKDDKSIQVPIVAVAAVSGVLVLLLIITVLLCVIVLFHWNRNKSRKACNLDVQQQNAHTIIDLSQSDHHTKDVPSRKPNVEPTSQLETTNGAYISTKAKSLDSLLRQHNHNRSVSNAADCNVTITPNPSYVAMSNTPQDIKEPEQLEYDYIYDLLVSSAASVEVHSNVSNSASDGYANINPNPSYSSADNGQDDVTTHPLHN